MHVILASTSYCDTEVLESVIKALGFEHPDPVDVALARGEASAYLERALPQASGPGIVTVETVLASHKIDDWLEGGSSTWFIASCSDPVNAISRAVADEGLSLRCATDKWIRSAREVLRIVQTYRERSFAFWWEEATENREVLVDVLGREWGLSKTATIAGRCEDNGLPLDESVRAVVWHALSQSKDVEDLRDELDASATPLGAARQSRDPNHSRGIEEIQTRTRLLEHCKDENALLLLQLHQMQEKLASYHQTNEAEGDSTSTLLENYERLKVDVEKIARQRDKAQHNLDKMKKSKSWRLTAPLRALRNSVTR